jgi:DNA primase
VTEGNLSASSMSRFSYLIGRFSGVHVWPVLGVPRGPIHDESGELVAYAGRSVNQSNPRYKFPTGFRKSQVLFNLHRVTSTEVVVVEGFFDCMTVWQSHGPMVVALMGCSLSRYQEQLLLRHFRRVTLLLDGDAAGRHGANTIAERLVRKLYVRIVNAPEGTQPDQLTLDELNRLLTR